MHGTLRVLRAASARAALACGVGLACATPPPPTPATYENLEPMLRKEDAVYQAKERKDAAKNREPSATCELKATETSNVTGKLELQQAGPYVIIRGRVTGLNDGQEHGLQVHSGSICGSDASAAGEFFNPLERELGNVYAPEHHAGALDSLVADGQGVAGYEMRTQGVTISSGATSIEGRTIVVHEAPDPVLDPESARLACCVIRLNR